LKSITIFTESYPSGKGETFLKEELEHLEKRFDTVLIIPMGIGDADIIWHKGTRPEVKSGNTRIRTLLRKNWKLMLKIMKYEWRASHNTKYIFKPVHFFKMLVFSLKKSEQLHNEIPESSYLYSYWYANWALSISMLKNIYRPKAKWATRMHGYDVDVQQTSTGYYPFRKWNNQYLNTAIFISEYGRKLFKKDNVDFTGNLELAYLGIDERRMAPMPKGSAFIIVSCSSVLPVKRLDKMASILGYLSRRVLWLHFGDGPGFNLLLKHMAKLPDNIGFEAKGYVKNEDLLQYYLDNEVDLFINSSKLEGVPFSMIEAGAHGIPLAGFNICGIPELISKNMGVLMDEKISNKENADKLESFLISQLSRDRNYRENIRKEVVNKFAAKQNYNKLEKLIIEN
jgi:glycosyltransferase involved in cell wall biosynthesis